jgi:hypothetical protein
MTRLPAARRGTLLRAGAAFAAVIGLAAGMLALALVLTPAGTASASLGSVPAEVSTYVSSGAMVARLNDVYGPNASGTAGIKFDDTTKPGPISRVYEWTAARLANRATDHPVQLTNNWVVPVTIGGKSVGLATIWINPQTIQPELADFAPSAGLGTALTTVPATAALVRDTATGAWLALSDGKVTPLIAGRSGLTTPAPVDSLKLSSAAATPITTTEPNAGLALAIGVVGFIVIVIVVALLLPRGRRAKKKAAEAAVDAAPDAAPAPLASAEPEPTAQVPTASKSTTTQRATGKPTTGKAVTAASTARTSRRTPTTSTAAKPASSKPAGNRPAAAGPPVSKPPVQKQPPRPRTAKPNTTQKPPASGGDSDAGPDAGSPS